MEPFAAVPIRRPPRASGTLVASVWAVAFLLVVAGAGLAVHHWHPQWLRSLHLDRTVTASAPALTPSTPSTGSASRSSRPTVTTRSLSPTAASVQVGAPSYDVVVTASALCWVEATVSGSSVPVFAGIVHAGQPQRIRGSQGTLTVTFGSAQAAVTVQIGGRTVSGWSLIPAQVPYTVTFTS